MAVKINLTIITKNHAADQGTGFLLKSISKPNGCATTMPTAWLLNFIRYRSKMTYYSKINCENQNQQVVKMARSPF